MIQELILQQLQSYLKRNYHDAEIKTGDIAQALHQSERNLNRKLKTLAGASLSELLREFRLEKAKQLLGCKKLIAESSSGPPSSSGEIFPFRIVYGRQETFRTRSFRPHEDLRKSSDTDRFHTDVADSHRF